MRIKAGLGVAAAAAVAVSGCGGTHLTHASIEKAFAGGLGKVGYPGLTIKCPDVNDKVGTTFTCDVTGTDKFHKVSGVVDAKEHVKLTGTS
jgi:hypothetical protein